MGGMKSKDDDKDDSNEEEEVKKKRGEYRSFYCFEYEGKQLWFQDVFDLLKKKKYEEFEKIVEAKPEIINHLTYENHFEPTLLIDAVEYLYGDKEYSPEQDYSIVEYLSKHEKCDITMPDRMGNTPFYFATSRGKLKLLKWLLERDKSVLNKIHFSATPLHYAEAMGHKEIVEFFLQQDNIDVNIKNYLRKNRFCEKDVHKEIVKMIKDHREKTKNTTK